MADNSFELREVVDSDLPIFFAQQQDPLACQQAAFPSRDRAAFFAHQARVAQDPKNLRRTILCNGQVAGNVVSFFRGEEREVGYWLGREHWGQGIATRALAEYLRIDTHRPLFAGVVSDNLGSIRVLEKCGFKFDHTERSFSAVRAREIDELIFKLD